MDLNRVILAGNLARDPDLKFLPSGTAKCTLTLAVSRPPDKQGERMTDFLTVIAWRKHAEVLGEHVRKGEPLILEGRLQARDFTTEDGQKRHVVEVLLTDFSFVGNKDRDWDGDEAPPEESRAPRTTPRAAPGRRPAARAATRSRPAPTSEAPRENPPDDPDGEDVPF
jgi:single-strand DNA-binding protein